MGNTMSSKSSEKVIAPLSLAQVHTVHAHYKHHFRQQIENPTADTNHILNFSLKMDNFMMMNEMVNFLFGAMTMFGVKHFLGRSIDRYTVNFLGQKRGEYAAVAMYIIGFFYMMHKMNGFERNDINYLINPREMSGEIYLNTCLHLFPNKVNLELYQRIMMEKQNLSMLRMS